MANKKTKQIHSKRRLKNTGDAKKAGSFSEKLQKALMAGNNKKPPPANTTELNKESNTNSTTQERTWKRVDADIGVGVNFDETAREGFVDKNKQEGGQNPECFYQTQLPNSANEKEDNKKDDSELIIGLDFGTSCTKAVIRDNALKKSYAVIFNEETPYLISTELFINDSGVCGLVTGTVTGDEVITDIKLNLMGSPDLNTYENNSSKITAKELAVAYLALILRNIRYWFFKEHAEKYSNSTFVWELNIGLPSRSYDDCNMCNTFKAIALAAWNLSAQVKPISLDLAQVAFHAGEKNIDDLLAQKEIPVLSANLHPESVNVIPEVIAEIVGYDKSSMRQDGLHLLVDIGAGTVDATSFIIQSKSGGGAFKLHKNRLTAIQELATSKLTSAQATNGMAPLLKIDAYSPSNKELTDIDKKFVNKFSSVIKDVILATKNSRDPLSPNWESGLPVFVCGGGSKIQLYMEAINSCLKWFSEFSMATEFKLLDIPKPGDLEAPSLDKQDYHRVAVAYGLSFTFDDVKKVVPPRDIDDYELKVPSSNHKDKFIDKGMM